MKGLERLNLQTAIDNIICYKVVRLVPRPWYKWGILKQFTIPCTKRKFIRGIALGSDIGVLIPEHCGTKLTMNVTTKYACGTVKTEKTIPEYIVTEGIHAFLEYTNALDYSKKFKNTFVCRCEIPRNSLFYYGKFSGTIGIVANAIKITRVIQ